MKIVERKVYYCDFCRRHRLTAKSIETHEAKCVRNPDRRCGWCGTDQRDYAALAAAVRETLDVDALRRAVNGCPLCMLAAVVQADLTVVDRADFRFAYSEEVERFRREERADRGDLF